MFELSIDLRQLDTFTSRVAGFDLRLRKALVSAITRCRLLVETRAKQLVSGEVLHVRSGTLRRSITGRTEEIPEGVRGVIGSNVPYARTHELGLTLHIPEIRPRRAKALHFFIGGQEVFAMRARAHDVKMPERSFLRRALRENAERIRAEIRAAVVEAAPFGGGSVEI